jgi:small subunit ribosomal protein S1
MSQSNPNDPAKETFRPNTDPALDRQVEDAMGGVSLEQLYGFDKPEGEQPGQGPVATVDDRSERPGLRPGLVLRVDKDKAEVHVHLGGKDQGVVPLEQWAGAEPHLGGQEMFVVDRFDEKDAIFHLSREGAAQTNAQWETVQIGQVYEGLVNGLNKGGLEMKVGQLRAFLPAGQVDVVYHKDISVFLGQKLSVEITQVDRKAKNLIVSRRRVIEREKAAAKEKLLTEIQEGQVRKGTVRNVTDFGAFVDLGGMDGLIHVSELSHRRNIKPSDIVKVGDEVEVKILKIDAKTGKLSLSLREMMPDPWQNVEGRYPVGAQVTGTVTRVENFGAFVEVEDGIQGLLPISEMSWQRIRHASEIAKPGSQLRVAVINNDPQAKKLTFSLKQVTGDPWADVAAKFPRGNNVKGTVVRTTDFGAFVKLDEGVEGLVHISELANQRVNKVEDVVKVGQEVEVRVLDINTGERRISLSVKKTKDPVGPPPPPKPAFTLPAPKNKAKNKQLRGGLDF